MYVLFVNMFYNGIVSALDASDVSPAEARQQGHVHLRKCTRVSSELLESCEHSTEVYVSFTVVGCQLILSFEDPMPTMTRPMHIRSVRSWSKMTKVLKVCP